MSELVVWTEQEQRVLRDAARSGSLDGVFGQLPGRSKKAVYRRIYLMGLNVRRNWTAQEVETMTSMWRDGRSVAEIALKLGRSQLACVEKAKKHGISLGRPNGYEVVTDTARRHVMSRHEVLKVAEWAGVEIRLDLSPLTWDSRRQGQYSVKLVKAADIDAAIGKWKHTGSVEQMARKFGVGAVFLRKWLLRTGAIVNQDGPCRKHHRVTTEQVLTALRYRKEKLTKRGKK